MSDNKLTQQQFNQLQDLFNKGDRTGYYVKYYEFTGSDQTLEMAKISSFSEFLGKTAEGANFVADFIPGYPIGGVIKFSEEIASNHFGNVKKSFNEGRGGYFADHEIIAHAKSVWEKKGLGIFFPGNPEYWLEKAWAGKVSEAFNDPLGITFGSVISIFGAAGQSATLNLFSEKGQLRFSINDNQYLSKVTPNFQVRCYTDKTTGHTIYVEDTGAIKVGDAYVVNGHSREDVAKKYNIPLENVVYNKPDSFVRAQLETYTITPPIFQQPHQQSSHFTSIYTVKSGDTLSKIAQDHGISLETLKKQNPGISNPDHIIPGQKVNVYETESNAEYAGDDHIGEAIALAAAAMAGAAGATTARSGTGGGTSSGRREKAEANDRSGGMRDVTPPTPTLENKKDGKDSGGNKGSGGNNNGKGGDEGEGSGSTNSNDNPKGPKGPSGGSGGTGAGSPGDSPDNWGSKFRSYFDIGATPGQHGVLGKLFGTKAYDQKRRIRYVG